MNLVEAARWESFDVFEVLDVVLEHTLFYAALKVPYLHVGT